MYVAWWSEAVFRCLLQFLSICMPRYRPGVEGKLAVCAFLPLYDMWLKSSHQTWPLLCLFASYLVTSMPDHLSFGGRVSLHTECVHLTRLSVRQAPGTLLSPPPWTGVPITCRALIFLPWALEIEALALVHVQQALYWMNSPCNPNSIH